MFDGYFYIGIALLNVFCWGDIITTRYAVRINKDLEVNPIANRMMRFKYYNVIKVCFVLFTSLAYYKVNTIGTLISIYFLGGIFFMATLGNYLTIRVLKSNKIKLVEVE